MAGNGVKVTISAQDRASATLERINSRLARMQAPAHRAFGALQRFSQLTGLTRLRGGLSGVAREGVSAFRSIGQIAPVLGTVTSATSVAGVYRLASAWAKWGTELRTMSRAMGVAPQRLQTLQNAARLAGGSGEAVTGAMQGLAQTQWEMAHGFAPEAQATFQALFKGTGESLQQIEDMKPDQLYDRLIKRLRQIKNPAAQAIAAQKLLGGAAAGLMPILQQTDAEYKANIRLAERYGVTNQKGADAAARMQHSLTGLGLAAEGLGYSISEAIEPSVRAVIDGMAEWIAQNRQWIAVRLKYYFDEVADAVKRVVDWLKNGGWDAIVGKAGRIAHALGGWKAVAVEAGIAVAALYAAPVLAGLVGLVANIVAVAGAFRKVEKAAVAANEATAITGGGKLGVAGRLGMAGIIAYGAQEGANALGWQNRAGRIGASLDREIGTNLPYAYEAYKYFTSHGRTSAQASGLVARIDRESGFQKGISGDGGRGYGILQWHPDRQANFSQLFGHDIRNSTYQEQLKFADWELSHTENRAGSALASARTANEAGRIASAWYARPADVVGEAERTGAEATVWQRRLEERDKYGSNAIAGWAHDAMNRARGAYDQPEVRIEIEHKNAPEGVSARVTKATPGVKVHAVRTSRAMDPSATATGY